MPLNQNGMTYIILAILLIAGYTAGVCIKEKGIPYSISATYFAIKHKLAFGSCMVITGMLMMHVMLSLSTTLTMNILAMLSCIGLAGVGLAPDFRDKWTNKIHCTSAAITLICSQLWIAYTPVWWFLLPAWMTYLIYTGITIHKQKEGVFVYKFLQTKPMFWVEVTAISAETITTTYLIRFLT